VHEAIPEYGTFVVISKLIEGDNDPLVDNVGASFLKERFIQYLQATS
jgi:hypothetical protein